MLEANLFNAMTALVAARVYPDIAPENTPTPYITYQQVGGKPVNFLGAEYSDKKNARIQINVWDTTRIGVAILTRLIENAMVAAPLYGLIEGGVVASYEPELKLYGAMQDFSFWS
jgi:hypothetical protein